MIAADTNAPEPRDNPDLLGQDAAEQVLADALRAGRLHHAWLLAGPEGVGKATLAFRFARFVLAGGDAPADGPLALPATHPVFRRVAAGTHADLLTVARAWDEKRRRLRGEIVVDDVRKVADFLRLTPAEGGWRVVVVDGAEHLNRNAANALLKMLEEPPPRAMLLLVCAAPGRLLPTLRSRCRRLNLPPLATAQVATLLGRYAPELPPATVQQVAGLAEGSIGQALALAQEEAVALGRLVEGVLAALPNLPDLQAHEVADALARSETGFSTFMDLLRGALSQAVRAAARLPGRPPSGFAAHRPLDELCDVWQALTRLQNDTERFNLDKRQALISGLALLRG